MNYIVSAWGNGVSIGLQGNPKEIEADANLANSLFKANFHEDFFNGRINFGSLYKFYKFILYKHSLPYMMKEGCTLREATRKTKKDIRRHNILFKNFMLDKRPIPFGHEVGEYQDGDFGYEYED